MIYINLDCGDALNIAETFKPAVEQALREAAAALSAQAHAHIVERANEKLHSTREKFVKALSYEQVNEFTWVVTLDKSALWIEEGLPEDFDMLPGLLGSSKAKTARDGSRYLVVPFQHNRGPTQQTPAQASLTQTIKAELKQRGIPYGKLEKDAEGRARVGLLHSFDIMNAPLKTGVGPGQGHGPIGAVRQGPTGIPFLQGVRVYQRQVRDARGKESVKRAVISFRIASSKHQGQGRWKHPGLNAFKGLDEAGEWALREWENRIRDETLDSILSKL